MSATERRYVWYTSDGQAESFRSLEEGQAIHLRHPDCVGIYALSPDGTSVWLRDVAIGEPA